MADFDAKRIAMTVVILKIYPKVGVNLRDYGCIRSKNSAETMLPENRLISTSS